MIRNRYLIRIVLLFVTFASSLMLYADQRCMTTVNLNMRTGPSEQYPKVYIAPKGSLLTIVGDDEGPWVRVTFEGGDTLYAYRSYLTDVPETEQAAASRRHPVRNLIRIAFKVALIIAAVYVGFLILRCKRLSR